MNKLSTEKRAQILALLVEGNSLRAASRLADVSLNTVMKLLAEAGQVCGQFQDKTLRNLPCKRIQCDEIWSFVYAKQRNVKDAVAAPEGAGDCWTWTAIDADTKLVCSWMLGPRDGGVAFDFISDLSQRLANRVQLTTDGHRAYLEAVEAAFGADIDFAQLVKIYGPSQTKGPERKYSPENFCGTKVAVVSGDPDATKISTSFVERQNLTMRMSMRRFTRLTNGFSKKLESLGHAVALHFMHYNFARIHKSLRITPAMAAGISDHVWTMEEIVQLMDASASKPGPRGPYKKKAD